MSFLNIEWFPLDYIQASVIANEVGYELIDRLKWLTIKPKLIVDMGCGPGTLTSQLKKNYPDAEVLGIDLSSSMLKYAKEVSQNKFSLIQANAQNSPLRDQTVDLIFANFLLPWHIDFKSLLREWRRLLHPEGVMLLTTLGIDTLKEYQIFAEMVPGRMDMHDLGDALIQTGFAEPVLDVNHYSINYREKTLLIKELKASGMWCTEEKKAAAIDFKLMPVNYEVIFAHAFAPENQSLSEKNDGGDATFPLSHLRRSLPRRC